VNNETFLSLYEDSDPTIENLNTATNRLSIAFPKMPEEFFILLTEFILKEKFTAKRLEDAVNHVIRNFQYKEFNISDIIKFDKRVKLYTGKEYISMQMQGFHTSEFEKRVINDEVYWVKKIDLLNK